MWVLLYHYFYALSISLLRQMLLLIDIISSYTFFFSHCVMGMTYFRFFYQTLISEAPDAMTPAPLSASWLKSNLLRPQEIAGPDRKSPCLQKKHTVLLFLIHSRKTSCLLYQISPIVKPSGNGSDSSRTHLLNP